MKTVYFMIIIMLLSVFPTSLMAKTMNGFNIINPLVPEEEILHGGVARDGIPSIDNPGFIKADDIENINNNDYILGIERDGVAKAYPVSILNWHEIVNDTINGTPIVVTYCPLCGSGMVFDATIRGEHLIFGVSGLLYNSDVLLYDRKTESLWSQIKQVAISGSYKNTKLEMIPSKMTTWALWKMEHPNTLVLDFQQGFNRQYSYNPYSGYESSNSLYFPVSYLAKGLMPKDKVIGLSMEGVSKAWPLKELKKQGDVINDTLAGKGIKIIYNAQANAAEIWSQDDELLPGVTMFWFAWSAFYPETLVYLSEPGS